MNNGVYRAGFAMTQEAYDEAVASSFKTLDWLEAKLSRSRYLLGDQLSEGRHPAIHDAGADRAQHGHDSADLSAAL